MGAVRFGGGKLTTAAGKDLTIVSRKIEAGSGTTVQAPGARLALVAVNSAGEGPSGVGSLGSRMQDKFGACP